MLRYKRNQCYSMYVTLQAQSVLLYVCYVTSTISVTVYATLQAQSVLLYVCYATSTISVTVYYRVTLIVLVT
jgi:hypothetical protein